MILIFGLGPTVTGDAFNEEMHALFSRNFCGGRNVRSGNAENEMRSLWPKHFRQCHVISKAFSTAD